MPAHLRSRPLVHPDDIAIPRELENNKLPIFTRYQEIMAAIDNNAVTILAAETGAGKTTQIPQFILAHENLKRAKEGGTNTTNIVITQPRRIAAISVAQRVANERGEQVGRNSAIGYTVRFDDKRPTTDPANGHAIFCTSGILLKRLQQDPQLRNVSHIILDEVHERDLNTDLLLIIVRQLVKARPDLRVILMSATAETELFQSYFRGFGTVGPDRSPPIINVKGRMFPVEQHFLEDIEHLLQAPRALPARFNPSKESVHWYRNETGPMIAARGDDPVPYDYIEALIAHIATCRDEGAILVFLPGWQEIDTLQQRLREDERYRVGFANERMFRIFPLHSQVPTDKQQAVFEPAPPGVRKIILSTNIAETSVTINDVVYVIDLAKLRMNSYDADRRISSLNSVFASLSNLRQRSGRAGRVRPGMYFSLLSHKRKQRLPYSMPPELLRVDLQATVLKVKSLNLARRVADVFAAAPQSPNPGAVIRAVQDLQSLGALDSKEELTTIGQVLSNMPVDPWIGKMVLEAATLGCLDPILTIAGGMEIGRGIFAIHPDEKDKGRAHILTRYARDTESDHLTLLQAFRGWKKVHDNGRFADSKQYAFRNYLHHTSLQNIERSRQQLLKILEDAGFVSRQRRRDVGEEAGAAVARSSGLEGMVGDERSNALAHNFALVRAVICGALYPNVAEITGKDEYATATVSRLRLTTASVNSMRGL
ncbi:P-loop containing nucleoside triphosphate hydrolase protein, partial [Fimicolochytrium jonesii]|uniref:P-loop containing nucleoside triphosphate hydrolase protein n=1 Tax=Fimicolochytrium jonesii TaxID=1396493 RepID=UPI0022FE8325